MKAISFSEHGGPEVLKLDEVPTPEPTGAQVRVKVAVAGVNPIDWKIRSGGMPGGDLPSVPGLEVAGVVDAVGPESSGLSVGDEVFGWSESGGYAEYAVGTDLVRKPADLDWNAAVAIPVAFETASRAFAALELKSGDTLLVHGAAGTVGTAAVQVAKKLGATVIGTASAGNQDYVRDLGATPTLYGDGLVERVRALAPNGVDAVFDTAGKGALPDSVELRGGSTDRIVTIADPAAFALGITFSSGVNVSRDTKAVADAANLVAAGEFSLPEPRVYALADAAAAQQESEHGHGRGKIVLEVSS